MISSAQILCIDDDPDFTAVMNAYLKKGGYHVFIANDTQTADEIICQNDIELIYLDVLMPGVKITSYAQNLAKKTKAFIVFVTGMSGDESFHAWANRMFVVKSVLKKPIDCEQLLHTTRKMLEIEGSEAKRFSLFVQRMQTYYSSEPADESQTWQPHQLYHLPFNASERETAELTAEFCHLELYSVIDPASLDFTLISQKFCEKNGVLPIRDRTGEPRFLVTNPFSTRLLQDLQSLAPPAKPGGIITPSTISWLQIGAVENRSSEKGGDWDKQQYGNYIYKAILAEAVYKRASDIHIVLEKEAALVQFRIDGSLIKIVEIRPEAATLFVSRFKVLSKMRLDNRRSTQDGSFQTDIAGKEYQLRQSTTITRYGEGIVIRILDANYQAEKLTALGFSHLQEKELSRIISKQHGLILIVGLTGSGKTTTVYSLLSELENRQCSLLTIEDPIEYPLFGAAQQEVNSQAGNSFSKLLKGSVRQDPDILFIGELRDVESAKTALDFASTGHLTISTMHTHSPAAAIFRLKRLGVDHRHISESVSAIIAQQLLRTLCPKCKSVHPPSSEEDRLLKQFKILPALTSVATKTGCPHCDFTGYSGRVAVAEILRFTPDVIEAIHNGASNAEIEQQARESNFSGTMADQAVEKMRSLLVSPADVIHNVLQGKIVTDDEIMTDDERLNSEEQHLAEEGRYSDKYVFIVDDDIAFCNTLKSILDKHGISAETIGDGVDAMMALGRRTPDLIFLDIQMPKLNGFMLLELMRYKRIDVPVVIVSATSDIDMKKKAIEKGACCFIAKPVNEREVSAILDKVF